MRINLPGVKSTTWSYQQLALISYRYGAPTKDIKDPTAVNNAERQVEKGAPEVIYIYVYIHISFT